MKNLRYCYLFFIGIISSLFTDSDSLIRRILLEHSVAELSVFFNRQRGMIVKFIFRKSKLHRLLGRRTAQEHVSALTRHTVASGVEARAFCIKSPNWVPKGVLIAHLHEHKAAVTSLLYRS